MDKAVSTALKEFKYIEGNNLEIHRFFLNSCNLRSNELKEVVQQAINEINNVDPDVVVVFADVAMEYIGLALVDTKYPVVFLGTINNSDYFDKKVNFMLSLEHPGKNITGFDRIISCQRTIDLAKRIIPAAKKIVVFSAINFPYTLPIVDFLEKDIRLNKSNYSLEIVAIERIRSYEEFQEKVLAYNTRDDVDAILWHNVRCMMSSRGRLVPSEEVLNWEIKNNKKPTVTWSIDYVKLGLLAGDGIDAYQEGSQAGVYVARILNGVPAGDLPIIFPRGYYIAVNLARAKMLGIEIPFEVIVGSEQYFTEMKAYPQYKYNADSQDNDE
jgi:ABC-type uncharacterized transport system substrate-binding protein